MITRTATAILAAIFLVTISSQADAARTVQDQFCGDRYCGQQVIVKVKSQSYKKSSPHASKSIKRVQVASIGDGAISEGPAAYGLVAKASQYLGQTASQVGVRSSLWCSAFIRKLTNASGVDDRAISWLSKPRANYGCIGCLAVMRHHIGIVKGYENGNPVLISGNHRHRVGIGAYPRSRIIAYVQG